MHPAPSLIEAPPQTNGDEARTPQQGPPSQRPPTPSQSTSPPLRKDTNSSISTQATSASGATSLSTETNNTSYSADTSPNLHQSIFSVKDGTDVSNNRRASRRRTGPLSRDQREKAALIRKLGACNDCRRRRVACHPSHHSMTWEDAMRKFHRSHSPIIQDIAPIGRPLSPAPALAGVKPIFTHDPQEMDIDSTPSQQPGRMPLSDARIRTPLPSGPRPDKPVSLPGIDSLKPGDLQANVSKILSTPGRNRYSTVQVLLLFWQEDDPAVHAAVQDLAEVLERNYHYTFDIQTIPSSSDGCKSSWRWLSRRMTDFVEDRDQRDVLKIVYYNGHSYLDGNREMVLASTKDRERASTIRWSGIQQILEEACSDTLIIMDAAYYPSSKMVRQQGVLELIAASVSDEHFRALDRSTFTRALTEQLKTRAGQSFNEPLSAAEIHAKLLSNYPKLIQDKHPEQETITSFPSPLHMQTSGNSRLPSILLAPIQLGSLRTSLPFGPDLSGTHLNLSIRLASDDIDIETWTEWLRMMPDGIKDVKVEGPYRSFR